LNTLRAQLNPHFLFNALNTISAYVERNPRVARRMLEQLGDLLRMSLDHSEDQEIALEQELAFLDRYLAIQKVRFEDRLDVEMSVDPLALDGLVPTFVLQPQVENAVRYAISPRNSRGIIRVAAKREGQTLRLQVQDPACPPGGWRPPPGVLASPILASVSATFTGTRRTASRL
jgi:LytS/YehU family sensor histidine kinase